MRRRPHSRKSKEKQRRPLFFLSFVYKYHNANSFVSSFRTPPIHSQYLSSRLSLIRHCQQVSETYQISPFRFKHPKENVFSNRLMDMEFFEEAISQKSSLEKWKSVSDAIPESENDSSGGFDCNICLETVQDPVVTLCGHLYCWPCIYKWLHFQRVSDEDQHQQCPVCKAEISQTSLVPLYGKGQTTKRSKGNKANLGVVIPQRPLGPGCGVDLPRSTNTTRPYQAQQFYDESYSYQARQYHPSQGHYSSSVLNRGGTMTNTIDSRVGVFGEMVYARVFGNTLTNLYTYPNSYHLAGSNSPRVRRHVMQADRSLSRICFFLFCCLILCLLTF